jgi:hypothetical protein
VELHHSRVTVGHLTDFCAMRRELDPDLQLGEEGFKPGYPPRFPKLGHN